MSIAITAALLTLCAAYLVLMGRFAVGLRRVLSTGPVSDTFSPAVTVVIAARNEENTIERCLERVCANTYPDFDVVVVDDFSSDGTAEVVRRGAQRRGSGQPEIQLISLTQSMPRNDAGKAAAIEAGVAAARGDVILTTDADCLVGPGWIASMAGCMPAHVSFVSGPVLFEPGRRWHSRLQALEFLGLIAIGAGGIGAGMPNMCNSANIAYRRNVYRAKAPSLPHSGAPPDEVLLQALHAENPSSVAFCAAPAAAVRTAPPVTLRAFILQRRRWAGNGARYPSTRLRAVVGAIYGFYVMLTVVTVAAFFLPVLVWPLALALIAKMIVEASVLVPAARHFGQSALLGWLVPGQLIQIPYVVLIGIAGVVGNVDWKDRNLR